MTEVDDLARSKIFSNTSDAAEDYMLSERLRFNVFSGFLTGIRKTICRLQEFWSEDCDLINDKKAFYKIWSALQFSFCVESANHSRNRESFGESLAWAGYL